MFSYFAVYIKKALLPGFAIGIILIGFSACISPNSAQNLSLSPVRIGFSVSLTGTYSAQGKALVQGFDLWRDAVNKGNGLLGHPVEFVSLDDGSIPKNVTSNYQKLITIDHVDFLFGPYSSLLALPAAVVANKYHYPLFAPTGSAPTIFNKHFNNVFVMTLPSQLYLQSFSEYILTLPQGMAPKTAAYVSVNNPFTKPQVNSAMTILAGNGVQTVYNPDPYPASGANIAALAQQIVNAHPDIVVLGTSGLTDCISFIKTFKQQHYNPQAVIATSGPDEGADFLTQLGKNTAEGVFVPNPGWYPGGPTYQNAQFVQSYLATYGGTDQDISATTSEAYSAGQLLEQAVNKIHNFNNANIIQELHAVAFNTLQGPMKFDANGANNLGIPYLFQWQQGVLIPVYPDSQAQANPEYPKTPWA